ncbi:unnamed protein product [Amoebophrya sp. A120]|nr:unnamed protein product [Amoebophrya sp. A120]|eukprot:GSA120T00014499001.1
MTTRMQRFLEQKLLSGNNSQQSELLMNMCFPEVTSAVHLQQPQHNFSAHNTSSSSGQQQQVWQEYDWQDIQLLNDSVGYQIVRIQEFKRKTPNKEDEAFFDFLIQELDCNKMLHVVFHLDQMMESFTTAVKQQQSRGGNNNRTTSSPKQLLELKKTEKQWMLKLLSHQEPTFAADDVMDNICRRLKKSKFFLNATEDHMNGSSAAAIPSRGGQVDSDLIVVSLGVLYQKVLEIVGEYELSPQIEFYLLFCVQTSKLLPLLCDFNDLFEPKLEKIWQEWQDEKQKISMQMNGIDLRQQGQDSHSEQALLQFRSAIAMSIVLEKTFGSAKKSFSTMQSLNKCLVVINLDKHKRFIEDELAQNGTLYPQSVLELLQQVHSKKHEILNRGTSDEVVSTGQILLQQGMRGVDAWKVEKTMGLKDRETVRQYINLQRNSSGGGAGSAEKNSAAPPVNIQVHDFYNSCLLLSEIPDLNFGTNLGPPRGSSSATIDDKQNVELFLDRKIDVELFASSMPVNFDGEQDGGFNIYGGVQHQLQQTTDHDLASSTGMFNSRAPGIGNLLDKLEEMDHAGAGLPSSQQHHGKGGGQLNTSGSFYSQGKKGMGKLQDGGGKFGAGGGKDEDLSKLPVSQMVFPDQLHQITDNLAIANNVEQTGVDQWYDFCEQHRNFRLIGCLASTKDQKFSFLKSVFTLKNKEQQIFCPFPNWRGLKKRFMEHFAENLQKYGNHEKQFFLQQKHHPIIDPSNYFITPNESAILANWLEKYGKDRLVAFRIGKKGSKTRKETDNYYADDVVFLDEARDTEHDGPVLIQGIVGTHGRKPVNQRNSAWDQRFRFFEALEFGHELELTNGSSYVYANYPTFEEANSNPNMSVFHAGGGAAAGTTTAMLQVPQLPGTTTTSFDQHFGNNQVQAASSLSNNSSTYGNKQNSKIDLTHAPITVRNQKNAVALQNPAPGVNYGNPEFYHGGTNLLCVHPLEAPKAFADWVTECAKNYRLRLIGTLVNYGHRGVRYGFIMSKYFDDNACAKVIALPDKFFETSEEEILARQLPHLVRFTVHENAQQSGKYYCDHIEFVDMDIMRRDSEKANLHYELKTERNANQPVLVPQSSSTNITGAAALASTSGSGLVVPPSSTALPPGTNTTSATTPAGTVPLDTSTAGALVAALATTARAPPAPPRPPTMLNPGQQLPAGRVDCNWPLVKFENQKNPKASSGSSTNEVLSSTMTVLAVHPLEPPKSFEQWEQEFAKNYRLRLVGSFYKFEAAKQYGFITSNSFDPASGNLFVLQWKLVDAKKLYCKEKLGLQASSEEQLAEEAEKIEDATISEWLSTKVPALVKFTICRNTAQQGKFYAEHIEFFDETTDVPVFPKGNASAANWKGWPLLSEPPPPEKRNPPDHQSGKGKGKLPPAPPPPNAKLLDLVSSTLGGVYGDWARDALSSGGPTNPALNVIQSLMQGAAAQQQQQPLIQPPQGPGGADRCDLSIAPIKMKDMMFLKEKMTMLVVHDKEPWKPYDSWVNECAKNYRLRLVGTFVSMKENTEYGFIKSPQFPPSIPNLFCLVHKFADLREQWKLRTGHVSEKEQSKVGDEVLGAAAGLVHLPPPDKNFSDDVHDHGQQQALSNPFSSAPVKNQATATAASTAEERQEEMRNSIIPWLKSSMLPSLVRFTVVRNPQQPGKFLAEKIEFHDEMTLNRESNPTVGCDIWTKLDENGDAVLVGSTTTTATPGAPAAAATTSNQQAPAGGDEVEGNQQHNTVAKNTYTAPTASSSSSSQPLSKAAAPVKVTTASFSKDNDDNSVDMLLGGQEQLDTNNPFTFDITEELKAEQERDEKEKREEQDKLLDSTIGGPETAAGASGSSSTTLKIPPGGVGSSSSTSQILQTSTSKSFDKGSTNSTTTTFGINKQGDQSGKNKGGALGKPGDQQSGKKGKDNGRIDVVVPPISLPGQRDVLNNNAPLTMLLVHPNEFKHPKSFEKWAEECEKNPRLRIVGTLARFQAGKSGFIKSHFFIAEDRDLFTLQYKIYGLRERYIAEQQLLGNFAPDCSDPAIGNWLQSTKIPCLVRFTIHRNQKKPGEFYADRVELHSNVNNVVWPMKTNDQGNAGGKNFSSSSGVTTGDQHNMGANMKGPQGKNNYDFSSGGPHFYGSKDGTMSKNFKGAGNINKSDPFKGGGGGGKKGNYANKEPNSDVFGSGFPPTAYFGGEAAGTEPSVTASGVAPALKKRRLE